MKIYNTLTRNIEEFKPLDPQKVKIYSCGPTVYDYQHIGHMRRYVGDDVLLRVLKLNNFDVKHVMNITDVGHLVSDDDTGEDKMEKGAKKFGKTVWEIANMFEEQFKDSCASLNISLPKDLMHATDYIEEQINLIKILEEKGFTYQIEDGVYFDSTKFKDYLKLSRQNADELKTGARVEMVSGKKHPTDFALWKFTYPSGRSFDSAQDDASARRQMEWDSPWGRGFPGWHIECSAMAMKAIGETLDIHTGGIDHVNVHHTNEIAQSEAATGKEFVKYWVHHNFLLVEGQKMSKSIGNIYTVADIINKGFDPLALRYLYLQTHYRQEMNFTFEALGAAQNALKKLKNEASLFDKPSVGCAEFEQKFLEAVNDDLNVPEALAVVWELVKSDYPSSAKAQSLAVFDQVLGLNLSKIKDSRLKIQEVPEEVQKLVDEREQLRSKKKFEEADKVRVQIEEKGYKIEDTDSGAPKISKL